MLLLSTISCRLSGRITKRCSWKMEPNRRDHPKNLPPHILEWFLQTTLSVKEVVGQSFCLIHPHMLRSRRHCVLDVQLCYQPALPRPVNTPPQSLTPITLLCAATSPCNLGAGKTVEISNFGAWTLWDKVQKNKKFTTFYLRLPVKYSHLFFIVALARSLWCRTLQHLRLNGGFTFDLQWRCGRLVARRCLECWSATLLPKLCFSQTRLHYQCFCFLSWGPPYLSTANLLTLGELTHLIYEWLFQWTLSLEWNHTESLCPDICVCVCVYMWEFALLSFCALPLAPSANF